MRLRGGTWRVLRAFPFFLLSDARVRTRFFERSSETNSDSVPSFGSYSEGDPDDAISQADTSSSSDDETAHGTGLGFLAGGFGTTLLGPHP